MKMTEEEKSIVLSYISKLDKDALFSLADDKDILFYFKFLLSKKLNISLWNWHVDKVSSGVVLTLYPEREICIFGEIALIGDLNFSAIFNCPPGTKTCGNKETLKDMIALLKSLGWEE